MSELKNSLSVVTILPPPNQTPGKAQLAQGTKVILSDGSELSRVTSVTLKAGVNGVWEATITVLPELIQAVTVDATMVEVEVTSLSDTSKQYALASRPYHE